MNSRLRILVGVGLVASLSNAYGQYPSPQLGATAMPTSSQHQTVPALSMARMDPLEVRNDWRVNLQSVAHKHEGDSILQAVKQLQNETRTTMRPSSHAGGEPSATAVAVIPSIQRNFAGGMVDYSIPNDDHIAISNTGAIVSVKNTNIAAYTENGVVLFNMSLNAFANQPNLTSILFDPKVVYDSGTDRFVAVCLHGNASSTSRIVLMVSTSGDPTLPWWIYTFNGDLLGNGAWFDYPNLGVTSEDIVLGGNLFYDNGQFQQGTIFQLPKSVAYAGQTLSGRYWYNITDNSGATGGSLYPMTYGLQGNYGPSCILMSTFSTNASNVQFWVLNEFTASTPTLEGYSLGFTYYQIGADAQQSGTSTLLDVGDCRIKGGFYLYDASTQTGVTHFVFTGDGQDADNYNELWYGKITWVGSSLTPSLSRFGLVGYDYCYPSVASFGTSGGDNSVMIGFLRSSSSTFPEMRVVYCDGGMNWSGSVQAKGGQASAWSWSGTQRWGDYIGIVRKKSSAIPTVWMSGCYGDPWGSWGTWIAEVTDGTATGAAPIADFMGSPLMGYDPLGVNFTDLSQNSPTSWSWSFPGGSPSSSTLPNPSVSYPAPGYYSVTLTTSNFWGADTEVKGNYVHVLPYVGVVAAVEDTQMTASIYPNPSFERFSLEFTLKDGGETTMELVNVNGEIVKLLYRDFVDSGRHILSFAHQSLPAGTYWVRIAQYGTVLATKQLVVME